MDKVSGPMSHSAHRLSERRGHPVSNASLEIPSSKTWSGSSSPAGFEGGLTSPTSRNISPSGSRLSPSKYSGAKNAGVKARERSPRSPSGKMGGLLPRRGRKRRWRRRVRTISLVVVVLLFVYFFGRTTYQLSFFIKAAQQRYWYHPLEVHRPIPCGTDTAPLDSMLAALSPPKTTDGFVDAEEYQTSGARKVPRVVPGTSDGVVVEVLPDTKTLNRAGGGAGVRQTRRLLGNGGEGKERASALGRKGGARGSQVSRGNPMVEGDSAGALTGGDGNADAAVNSKPRFAILTLCDAKTGYICTASAANKRRYAELHGYDLIVATEVADRTRPAAWSKILEVRKYLPAYDWLMFIDVDTLIMNPNVRLEDIADDSVDQIIGADHNGVNSGVWMVKNTPWMMWFLDELWAQEHLVRGNYLFHYEQRAFHHLFQTVPWSRQKSVKGQKPYPGAATVRAHSKIVNQCVFNSLLPWYVSGDFVLHFAGLKGVWECVIFWHYFDLSQEQPGMRVTEEQWFAETGSIKQGKASTLWKCMKFKTLF